MIKRMLSLLLDDVILAMEDLSGIFVIPIFFVAISILLIPCAFMMYIIESFTGPIMSDCTSTAGQFYSSGCVGLLLVGAIFLVIIQAYNVSKYFINLYIRAGEAK